MRLEALWKPSGAAGYGSFRWKGVFTPHHQKWSALIERKDLFRGEEADSANAARSAFQAALLEHLFKEA